MYLEMVPLTRNSLSNKWTLFAMQNCIMCISNSLHSFFRKYNFTHRTKMRPNYRTPFFCKKRQFLLQRHFYYFHHSLLDSLQLGLVQSWMAFKRFGPHEMAASHSVGRSHHKIPLPIFFSSSDYGRRKMGSLYQISKAKTVDCLGEEPSPESKLELHQMTVMLSIGKILTDPLIGNCCPKEQLLRFP